MRICEYPVYYADSHPLQKTTLITHARATETTT